MSLISLLWFGGMAPRMGEQHLSKPHSTEAENCNLYSGELRPLKKPALAHQFCRPGDDCFFEPLEDDPSWPPVQPPPPLVCVAVAIETQPGTPAVPIGGTATLSVGVNADATAPVYYQWFKNNELMPGETAQVLSVDVVAETSHDQYVVMVTNPCGSGQEVSIPTKISLDPPPECLPFECDALDQALKGEDPTAVSVQLIYDDPNFPYPFATTRPGTWGHPFLFTPWSLFVAGPQPIFDWNGSYPEQKTITSISWYTDASKLQRCGIGTTTQMVDLQSSSLQWAITPPTDILLTARGGSGTTAIYTGQSGGSICGITLHNGCAARVAAYRNSDDSLIGVYQNNAWCSLDSQSVTVGSHNTHGSSNASVHIGSVLGSWIMCSFTEGTRWILEDTTLTLITTAQASISRQDTGGSFNVAAIGNRAYENPEFANAYFELVPVYTFYQGPQLFRGGDNRRCGLAYLAHGADVNTEWTHTQFLRGFTDYEPPPECSQG